MTSPGNNDLLLPERRQALKLTGTVTLLTVVVFTLAAIPGVRRAALGTDRWWLQLMLSIRTPSLTVIAKALNPLGMTYVTLPVRAAIACYLAIRRHWWAAAAFVIAMAVSQSLSDLLKWSYGRTRPPDSLVATSGASFPSGHAVAASATCIAAAIVLLPAGRRVWWIVAAITFSLTMAWSRTYLAAHWLTDTVAGLLLGSSCALVAALIVDQIASKRRKRHPVPHDDVS